ncbi:MAG: flagellar type III secretion system pore protein FliP [Pseudomonadota bacterium]
MARVLFAAAVCLAAWLSPVTALAQAADLAEQIADAPAPDLIRTVVILTTLAIVPALFIVMTSFIRIAIVLAMVRHAFGMPQTPPNIVLISLSFFLTIFVMAPTLAAVNHQALQPYLDGRVELDAAVSAGAEPLKTFMMEQVREEDVVLMYELGRTEPPDRIEDVSLLFLTPAFILNELTVAFTIGFLILLPFLMIDLVVSSILLSLGMMMVPPATISLPIKILMFVVIDGWALVIQGVVGGFG